MILSRLPDVDRDWSVERQDGCFKAGKAQVFQVTLHIGSLFIIWQHFHDTGSALKLSLVAAAMQWRHGGPHAPCNHTIQRDIL